MAGKNKPAGKRAKAKKKNGPGAPSRYMKKYCQQMVDYFKRDPTEFIEKRQYYPNGETKSVEQVPIGVEMPTFQGFAAEIHVDYDTLLNWRDRYPEFEKAYKQAKQLQEHIWLVNGMSGLYNASFAMFFGKNCLGYKDKQEIDARVAGQVSEEAAAQALRELGYVKAD